MYRSRSEPDEQGEGQQRSAAGKRAQWRGAPAAACNALFARRQ